MRNAAGLAQVGGAKVDGFNPETTARPKRPVIEIGDIIIAAGGHPVDQVSTLQRDHPRLQAGRRRRRRRHALRPEEDRSRSSSASRRTSTTVADNSEKTAPVPVSDNPQRAKFDRLGITVTPVSTEFAEQREADRGREARPADRQGRWQRAVVPQLFTNDVIFSELYP